MKDLFNQISNGLGGLGGLGDKLNGALGGQQKADAPSGQGTGNALGDMVKSAGGLGGLLGSAALGGLLGTLMSGKTARKVAKGALMVGGTAAVGALAWKFYQKWSGANGAAPQGQPAEPAPSARPAPSDWPAELQQTPPPAVSGDQTALLLLEAMVFAARADGHIDDKERANIHNAVESLFPGRDMAQVLDTLLNKPLDPASLASRIANHDEARDLYRLSAMIIDVDHFMERSYLDGLAAALKIAPEEKAALDSEVEENKRTAIEPS